MHYSESPYGVGYTQGGGSTISHSEEEGQHLGPQGIMVFHDYDKGIAHAKKSGTTNNDRFYRMGMCKLP